MSVVAAGKRLRVDRGEDFVLAEEPGEGGNAREREAADEERRRRDRHDAAQAPEPSHVDDPSHRVHDGACAHEEQGLEEGVGDEVEDRGGEPEERARSEAHEHVAELADRRVGEHPLQVVLHRRDEARQEGGHGPHERNSDERPRAGLEERGAAGHEIDARRHHRGSVDEGACGGRPLHGVGQPDVKRGLRALAARRQEQTEADRRADGAADDPARLLQACHSEHARLKAPIGERHVVEIERAVGQPDEEHRDREAEVADAVDEERLLCGSGGLRLAEPESDQQVAAGPDRLPEDVDDEKIRRAHEHRHREDEEGDEREEPGVVGIVVHVADRVDGDEQADARDEREHRRRERIEPQLDRDGERNRRGRSAGTRRGERRAGGNGRGRGNDRVVDGGPVPERGGAVEPLCRLERGVGGVGGPVAGVGPMGCNLMGCNRMGRQQQHDGRHGRAGDADDRRQVCAVAEPSAKEHGQDRRGERQGGHEGLQGRGAHGHREGGCLGFRRARARAVHPRRSRAERLPA